MPTLAFRRAGAHFVAIDNVAFLMISLLLPTLISRVSRHNFVSCHASHRIIARFTAAASTDDALIL